MKPMLSNQSHFTSIKNFIMSLLLFVVSFALTAQTVHTVDNRPQSGAQFTNVAAAISAASPGDIIYIHPSPNSYGNIEVTKTLTIVGGGHNSANFEGIRSTSGTINLRQNSLNSVITGMNVVGSISAYSYGSNTADVHIINNRITGSVQGYFNSGNSLNWIIEGNYFDSGYTTNCIDSRGHSLYWTIRNNVILGRVHDIDHTSIVTNNVFIHNDPTGSAEIFTNIVGVTSPIVTNNIFIITDPDVTDISNSGSISVTYTNCLTYKDAGGVVLPPLPGQGNLDNTNPLFTSIPNSYYNFYENEFNLQAGSPASGYGTDGTDLGVYGRNFPYDNNGRPHSMPYPESMTILNTVVQPGQALNVEFQASQKN